MLKIKLARFGKRGQPHFRIIINEAKSKRDGKYIALIGRYVPTQQPKILELDVEQYKNWMGKGAQPTDTVAALFKRFQSGDPFPPRKPRLSKKAKTKLNAPQEPVKEVAKDKKKQTAEGKTATESKAESEQKIVNKPKTESKTKNSQVS